MLKSIVRVSMLCDFNQGRSAAESLETLHSSIGEDCISSFKRFKRFHDVDESLEDLDHKVETVQQKLAKLNWSVLPHPPYYPAIAPSHYYLFRSTQHELAEKRFENVEEVRICLSDFFNSKPSYFNYVGTHSLRAQWRMVIDNCGEHIME
ncbi:hypothetical protein RB195_003391 [Necator americanus]|uniref:Mos1 transposase HTH domain-containing protein n=1 Tax=Necator americanus TaxID=51031 RepID=A0ABR1DR52_NECAM